MVSDNIGYNLPQGVPRAFADAIMLIACDVAPPGYASNEPVRFPKAANRGRCADAQCFGGAGRGLSASSISVSVVRHHRPIDSDSRFRCNRMRRTRFDDSIDLRRCSERSSTVTMTTQQKVIYTARTHTTGGRDGQSRSSDGRLVVRLSSPGASGNGTNPEQLFAAGWSACFEGAMALVARQMKVALPPDVAIDAEVDLCLADGEYSLQARLDVSIPGVASDVAKAIVDAAERTCPYSKAIRANVPVSINLV